MCNQSFLMEFLYIIDNLVGIGNILPFNTTIGENPYEDFHMTVKEKFLDLEFFFHFNVRVL